MKLRIIKEESVYRIQELKDIGTFSKNIRWVYADKAIIPNGLSSVVTDFKTPELAIEFIEHNYIVKVVKEYEVVNK